MYYHSGGQMTRSYIDFIRGHRRLSMISELNFLYIDATTGVLMSLSIHRSTTCYEI